MMNRPTHIYIINFVFTFSHAELCVNFLRKQIFVAETGKFTKCSYSYVVLAH